MDFEKSLAHFTGPPFPRGFDAQRAPTRFTGPPAAGEPFAVYWDGPFKPWFMKRAEVHVPVRRVQ